MVVVLAALTVCSGPAFGESEIKLPMPSLSGTGSVEAAMVAKKSVRNFTGTPLTLAQVSQILWAANGNLPADAITGATRKVIPSAGGLYPLEIVLVSGKNTVTDLPEAVYLYKPQTNSLAAIASGDFRTQLSYACLGQTWLARAPAIVVIAAVFGKTTAKYGNRGYQYVFIEAGNSNQNVYLQAESLGLHAGTVGAFDDGQVSAVLKISKDITPLLVVAIGK
jgi:SagB-type dehydrogenase family enzyme